jgi:hypothetical protein
VPALRYAQLACTHCSRCGMRYAWNSIIMAYPYQPGGIKLTGRIPGHGACQCSLILFSVISTAAITSCGTLCYMMLFSSQRALSAVSD